MPLMSTRHAADDIRAARAPATASHQGFITVEALGDPWGMPGALEPPAATAVTCAAAWARMGSRLCSARRGATCWCYTLEPPVGAQRCRHAPPARRHHEGRTLGCYWCVREPQGAAALGGGWARQAAVVPGTACSGDSTGRARCWDGCGMAAQGSGVSTAAVSAAKCRQKRVERCFAPHGARCS